MHSSKNQFAEAELKISYRPPTNPVKISSQEDAQQFLFSVWDKELLSIQEQLYVLYLNQAKDVICWRCLHTGSITQCNIDVRLIFGFALNCCAAGLIIAHNHPSGNLQPSRADFKVTKTIKDAGKLLEIPLVDHLILAGNKCFSFANEGLLIG